MAKQAADHFTLDLLDKPKRGRPRKADAKTDAERARAYRARKRARKEFYRIKGSAIMYRGPLGETWTGKGQMPKWLASLIQQGHPRTAFLAWTD